MFARIALDHFADKEFDYRIPGHLSDQVLPGARVLVPFGNSQKSGTVLSLELKPSVLEHKIKEIASVTPEISLVGPKMLELLSWVHRYYGSSMGKVLRCAIPASVRHDAIRKLQQKKGTVRVGRNSGDTIPISKSKLGYVPEFPIPDSLEALRKQALDHRNDLKRQERIADQAAWELKKAYAKFLPQFDLEFKELLVDPESITDRNNFWTLLLKFHLPVLEGTDRLLEIKQRKLQLQQEKLRYERLKKDILLEVQDAWFTAQTLASTLEVANEETALAQENYDITTQRYKAGEATSVDVSDTFAKLVSARTDMTNLSYEYQVSLYNLERVVGTFAQEYME